MKEILQRRSGDNMYLREQMIENDRRGERTIAYFQALIAIIFFGFHIESVSNDQWGRFSPVTIGIAICILLLCVLRFWLATRPVLPRFILNALTFADGCVIILLISSYSYAFDLPLSSSLKAPSIIFLVLFTAAQVLKLDPVPILIAGATVLVGWFSLLGFSDFNGAEITNSYRNHVTSSKTLLGRSIEMAVGFTALTVVLVTTAIYVRRILANTVHISELESAKQNAEDLAARHRALFASSSVGILVVDQQGIIEQVNESLETMFGYSAKELTGKNIATLMPKENTVRFAQDINSLQLNDRSDFVIKPFVSEARHANGTIFPVELSFSDFKVGGALCFTGFVRDITEKKVNEAELVEAKNRAEIANRAKASFLAMMSHEIRTPLNGVLGILSLLSESVKDANDKKLVATARRSGRSLLTVINDILDFSKLEAGKLDLEITSFRTDSLIDSVHSLVGQQASQKSLALNFVISDDVHKVLLGDQDRIRQILLHLVWNAVKFTETGQVDLHVEASILDDHPAVRFAVSDTGIGVPEEQQGELFAEFATIDPSYARNFGGIGLGLSICKALTEAMGGKIGYSRNEPNGSVFWFEIPLPKGDENAIGDEDMSEMAIEVLSELGSVRLLMAEDNGTNQLVIGNMLERLGCVVDIVSNGQEAVDGILARNYDAILMDVSMPEMDGITATKIIRNFEGKKSKTPIIALTAYAMDEDRKNILASGMDDFVAKPVSRIELARAITRQVSGREIEGELREEKPKTTHNLFDQEILENIIAYMDDETISKIAGEFEKDVLRHLADLNEAVPSANEEQFERATHGLKGVTATFGASELSRLTSAANELIRGGETLGAFNMQDEIQSLCGATITSVRQKFGSNSNLENEELK